MLEGHLDIQRRALTSIFGRADLATFASPRDVGPRVLLGRNDVSAIVGRIEEESRFTSFDSYTPKRRNPNGDSLELGDAKQFDESDLNSLLKMLRQLVEHKVS